jgi:hypothetical protein
MGHHLENLELTVEESFGNKKDSDLVAGQRKESRVNLEKEQLWLLLHMKHILTVFLIFMYFQQNLVVLSL